jgi:transcriptional antiterminator Rof (Rho-off)
MNYKVVYADNSDDFEKAVMNHLRLGWQLVGGVCVHNTGYYQAMVQPR